MSSSHALTPRQVADRYVDAVADLDPLVGTFLGIRPGIDTLPDFSPTGMAVYADLRRATLTELDAAEAAVSATTSAAAAADGAGGTLPDVERRAARLLRERLEAELAVHESGDDLRDLNTFFSPLHLVRLAFTQMPKDTDDEWAVLGRRLRRVPESLRSYQQALAEGATRGLHAAPRQVAAVVEQLDAWVGDDWFGGLVADAPEPLRAELQAAAALARTAYSDARGYLADTYAPSAAGTPDAVGRERYARWARHWTGSDVDLEQAYAYGWDEYHRLVAEITVAADAILPGSSPKAVMRHLDDHGEAVEGVEEVRLWLQRLMDDTMADLDGVHVDLADPVRRVESMIAPAGSAAAGYYTRPSLDFARPGRTWFPTLGHTRFPTWSLVSTWYHEGVPGHHLQLAQWVHVADTLSRYQVSLGSVSASTEGWALYAERLMDELGYLTDPGRRLGYLDSSLLRAIRVIIDIGMHLELPIPAHSDFRPGETWTPESAREFVATRSGLEPDYVDSEIVRYLGIPGQAISYKLGERAWLAGREAARAARAARGGEFDLKAWHMAALSMGSLGLDDLTDELAQLS